MTNPHESEKHQELYGYLSAWRQTCMMIPYVSLTISVGDPIEQSFIADPFKVSSLLGTRSISIS